MAQWIDTKPQMNQRMEDADLKSGFEAFGKAVPGFRRKEADRHCIQMGLDAPEKRSGLIARMCEAISQDEPETAMEAAMAYLDLTGTYRLLAVLLTAPKPRVRVKANTVGHHAGA